MSDELRKGLEADPADPYCARCGAVKSAHVAMPVAEGQPAPLFCPQVFFEAEA